MWELYNDLSSSGLLSNVNSHSTGNKIVQILFLLFLSEKKTLYSPWRIVWGHLCIRSTTKLEVILLDFFWNIHQTRSKHIKMGSFSFRDIRSESNLYKLESDQAIGWWQMAFLIPETSVTAGFCSGLMHCAYYPLSSPCICLLSTLFL